jgi:hypothetical protein
MAIQDKTLSGAEHDWFATRSGAVANAPLTEHKRAYFTKKGITGTKPLTQMEREWLQTLTNVTSQRLPDMWSEAVSGQGKTPSKDGMDANKFIFYTQVTASP